MFNFDPSPIALTLPFINLSITWYGIFFASGLIIGCLSAIHHLKKFYKDIPLETLHAFIDSGALYATTFLLLGARLVEAFFYSPHLLQSPWHFIAVWEGGLASHGGILGLGVGCLLFYYRNRNHPVLNSSLHSPLLSADIVSLSGVLCGIFIRLGNFMNQEIVGKASTLPWTVVFKHPRDFVEPIARHPAQLYEALGYFLLWVIQSQRLYRNHPPGLLMAQTLLGVFIIRWIVEYFKAPVHLLDGHTLITRGQFLSLPFIALALILIYILKRNKASTP
jgi:phosphatidylglycerol:prolipoprotein diacylglycerol transferase